MNHISLQSKPERVDLDSSTADFAYLFKIRETLGEIYGSEDLAMFFYSMVKREKPRVFVELGTGLGVTTLWIAAAMRENGFGTIYTVDNGEHYNGMTERYRAVLEECINDSIDGVCHEEFVERMAKKAGVAGAVKYIDASIDVSDLTWLDRIIASHSGEENPKIDIMFSDFNHSANTIVGLMANTLPRLSQVGSLFIDSASTNIVSYYMIERIVEFFTSGKIPIQLLDALQEATARDSLQRVVRDSTFRLMHLVERRERKQNSTTWLRVEPATLTPPLATFLH